MKFNQKGTETAKFLHIPSKLYTKFHYQFLKERRKKSKEPTKFCILFRTLSHDWDLKEIEGEI